ncbi:hypothetical protein AALA22_03235 [Anaerovoracaceae bacterium 41-7]|jgi:hypothetical protein|uniref:Uncharacterized protein n=1 Tax=Anaerotruncus colihominis TaxID=169435 RepID=A0A845QK01_9FIRM|nr:MULTISPECIES: hypothetical protein [Clostridia]MCI9477135.1 hypothetical protein [Emergencia sp.]MCI9640177.1 hypothetical protein [Emergencia sp.]NBH61764.1 hypothetical protein [Anaerotruncus colihominis]NCE98794.1 hypothetical protein [Emergencia sp. 1XD21-10]NCF02419.1 hypothetical protein [Anaerotruncus sp. 80]
MANNPIPILAVLFLLKSKNTGTGFRPPVMNTLELESMLDNAHSMIHTIEKLRGFAQVSGQGSLPDMKKMMEIVEKLPL